MSYNSNYSGLAYMLDDDIYTAQVREKKTPVPTTIVPERKLPESWKRRALVDEVSSVVVEKTVFIERPDETAPGELA